MKKIAFFAFKGSAICFVHVLLNAIDLVEKGHEATIIMEGEAVTIIKELEESQNKLYLKAKKMGLFSAICKACSAKLGVLEFNETVGIPVVGDLAAHPSMEQYLADGYAIITM